MEVLFGEVLKQLTPGEDRANSVQSIPSLCSEPSCEHDTPREASPKTNLGFRV